MTARVLITGGASGIGREIAIAFHRNGAAVSVLDRDTNALSAIAGELPGLHAAECDLAQRASIERVVPAVIAALGGLDVLVNNAGIAGPTAPVEEYDPEAWEQVLQVNLSGTFNVTRLAIPALKQSGAGSIIMMSSLAGRLGYPYRSAYAVTKWGLVGLTKTLSRELGEYNIRVNAILPGGVQGPRAEQVFAARAERSGRTLEEERKAALGTQSLKRLVDPRDIAALAVFLASDAGKSISGQMLPIDNDAQVSS